MTQKYDKEFKLSAVQLYHELRTFIKLRDGLIFIFEIRIIDVAS